jgi:hypothetical protein
LTFVHGLFTFVRCVHVRCGSDLKHLRPVIGRFALAT